MARGDPELRIRIPEDLKAWIEAEARRSVRSQTAQIVVVLRSAKDAQEASAQK